MVLEDIEFLIEQIKSIPSTQEYELPSVFAERVRRLTADLSPFPGRFSFSRFPYFKEIADLFSPLDPTEDIVVEKGNQIGFTTAVLETVMLYHIMAVPKPQMFVTADANLVKTQVATRIEKMIDGAGARPLIYSQSRKASGSQNTGDTSRAKEYPGGYLHVYGSKNPASFRGMSYRVSLADEVDAYKDNLADEGSVISLVENRTDAYEGSRKRLWGSTPLIKGNSKIETKFEEGDQRKYFVPCKHCGTMQELIWHGKNESGYTWGIVWENDENFNPIIETVGYKCQNPDCGGIMKNYDKAEIIAKGEWRPTAKPKNPNTRSYHISPLYNPPGMFSWESMVKQWAECWDIRHNRILDIEKYRTFRNNKQGKTFEEPGTQIRREKALQFRRSGFAKGTVPNKQAIEDTGTPILIVIASVDVQKYNLYVDVKGYSKRGATWTLDFFDIPGETEDFNGPWDKLDDYFENKRFEGDDGKTYRIALMLVDSGWNTDYVYAFAGRHYAGVYASKGIDKLPNGETYKLFDNKTLDRIGLPQAYHINTTKLKDRISLCMNDSFWNSKDFQPTWYPNFPEDFRDDYFAMFEAEQRIIERDKKTNKWLRTIWKQKSQAANHAFDTYAYNLAALEIFADDYCRRELSLPGLDWIIFWDDIKDGKFIER